MLRLWVASRSSIEDPGSRYLPRDSRDPFGDLCRDVGERPAPAAMTAHGVDDRHERVQVAAADRAEDRQGHRQSERCHCRVDPELEPSVAGHGSRGGPRTDDRRDQGQRPDELREQLPGEGRNRRQTVASRPATESSEPGTIRK